MRNRIEPEQTYHLAGWSHLSEYTTLGCRCQDCRDAWKVYSRDYRERTRAKIRAQVNNSAPEEMETA